MTARIATGLVTKIIAALDHEARLGILLTLSSDDKHVSFSELGKETGLGTAHLALHLRPLVQTALVTNTYRKTAGRDYSFYELSSLGREWLWRIGLRQKGPGKALASA